MVDGDLPPDPLADLGPVFVRVAGGSKVPITDREPENLHAPDDTALRRHLADGGNYGLTSRGSVALLDVDDPDVLDDALEELPATVEWPTGTPGHRCRVYRCPGLDADLELTDPATGENVGHIKAGEQSYAVGPGSTHENGRTYGPVEGDAITPVAKADLLDAVDRFTKSDDGEPDLSPDTRGSDGRNRVAAAGEPGLYDVISRRQYPPEQRQAHPFHASSTGSNFKVHESEGYAYCYRHGSTLRGIHLWAIDAGLLDCSEVGERGDLPTDRWRAIYAAAREDGYEIERTATDDPEHAVVLPNDPTPDRSWDWEAAARGEQGPTLKDTRDRVRAAMHDAVESGRPTLLDALPGLGKTRAAAELASEVDEPTTYLTHRYENREQVVEWAREAGLRVYSLPVFTRDCETASGEHGDVERDRVMDLYRRELRGSEIHKWADDPPCEHDGGCPYSARWRFDADDYDLLVGHPCHAAVSKVTTGRAVLFDESIQDAFETPLGPERVRRTVNTYLDGRDDLPADDVDDLRALRQTDDDRADAIAALLDVDGLRDPDAAIGDRDGHTDAPAIALTLLAGDDLGNGFDRVDLPEGGVGIYDREDGSITLRQPPDLLRADAVVALDGTPTSRLWEGRLGLSLDRQQVLDDHDRREYLTSVLGLQVVQTTDYIKPYSSGEYVNLDADTALLEEVRQTHGERPPLITSADAERQLVGDDGPAGEHVRDSEHYGNLKGTNRFADRSVGVVLGSPHYGDREIQRLAALEGHAIESNGEYGTEKSYGAVGDEYLHHIRENQVLQAAMRFGRQGQGATVYVGTACLPEWVPRRTCPGPIRVRSTGEREVVDALTELGRASSTAIAEQASISPSTVRKHLRRLADGGDVRKEGAGRATEWVDDGLEDISLTGDVDLPEPTAAENRSSPVLDSIRGTTGKPPSEQPADADRWALTDGGRSVGGRDGPCDGVDPG